MKQHLDIFDPRRTGLFEQAQCSDCEHYLRGQNCEAEAELVAQVLMWLFESAADAYVPGLRIIPNSDDSANRCPMFWPGFEYRKELEARRADDYATWSEDMNRLAAMGRRAA